MFCPYYKNREVFDGFNEIVQAFGGDPLTEEEFRSSELRNQRTGPNYSAMEAAYIVYDRNNGNMLDFTPDGQPSILFQKLLDYYGDRNSAIIAKSNAYSDEFLDKKNWLSQYDDAPDGVTKTVQQNGKIRLSLDSHTEENPRQIVIEPQGDNKYYIHIRTWNGDHVPAKLSNEDKRLLFDAVYNELPVGAEILFPKSGNGYYATRGTVAALKRLSRDPRFSPGEKGVLQYKDDPESEEVKEYEGTGFIKNKYSEPDISDVVDDYINPQETDVAINNKNIEGSIRRASVDTIGVDNYSKLAKGETVSSKNIIQSLKKAFAFSIQNSMLADIFEIHDIPVTFDSDLDNVTLMTSELLSDGTSVIRINRNLIGKVTQDYISEAFLHEIVHSLTMSAFRLKATPEQVQLVNSTNKLLKSLRKEYYGNYNAYNNVDSITHALKNSREFVSVFITDAEARNELFSIAKQLDDKKYGKHLTRLVNFINSVTQFLVNKNLINSSQSLLNRYQKTVYDYLNNRQMIKNGKVLSKAEVKKIQSQLDKRAILNGEILDRFKHAQSLVNVIETNPYIIKRRLNKKEASAALPTESLYSNIIDGIKIRINALRSSDLQQVQKNKLIQEARTFVDMFENEGIVRYVAISSMLSQVIPNLLDDIKQLRAAVNENAVIDSKSVNYHIHSNFGLYKNIIQSLSTMFTSEDYITDLVNEYNSKQISESNKISRDDALELKQTISDISSVITDGLALCERLLNNSGYSILEETGRAVNNPDIEQFLSNLETDPSIVSTGINGVEAMFSAADSMDNIIVITMENMLNNALVSADNKVTDRASEIMKIISKINPHDIKLLYEFDEKGRTTGYLVRDRNFGKMYKDYDEEIQRINQIIKDKYNLTNLDVKLNRTAPYQEDARIEWNQMVNAWKAKYTERKMLPKYYDLWNGVSTTAKSAIGAINTEISLLLQKPGVVDELGHRHLELLTDDEFWQYQQLSIQKKVLRSDRDEFGRLKDPNSEEYKIAKELQTLYSELYSDSKDTEYDTEAWQAELDYNIDNVWGGREEYNKYLRGEENDFDIKAFRKWHSKNSVYRLKQDDEGKAIVYKLIEQELGMVVDYGEEVEDLLQQRREIYNLYRGVNSDILGSEIPDTLKGQLKDLDRRINIAKNKAKRKNSALSKYRSAYRKVQKKYIKFINTDEFERLKAEAKRIAAGNEVEYYKIMLQYGYSGVDELGEEYYKPYSWFTKAVAVDENLMEYVPNFSWAKKEESKWSNPFFDDSYGSNMIPKKIDRYDNSEAFSKVSKKDTPLNDLYKIILKTYKDSNSMQTNRQFVDDYLLAQQTGSIWKKMKNHGFFGAIGVLIKHMLESIGLGIGRFSRSFTEQDLVDTVQNSALDLIDDEVGVGYGRTPIRGQYPDGREFHVIPQYYTRKLEDPSQLSADLIGITLNYYKMSCYYEAKQKIRDDLELLLDYMRQDRFKYNESQFVSSVKKKLKVKGAVDFAKTFLEMNLYDVRRDSKVWFQGTPLEFQFTKFLNQFKNYTTTRNLGWSPKVALVGMATSLHAHHINMLVGQNYGLKNAAKATLWVLKHVYLKNIGGANLVGDNYTNDIITLIAEKFRLANQFERKTQNSNRKRGVRILSRISDAFGMLSYVDYITKVIIAVSVMDNYHKVGNSYISEDELKNERYKYSKEEFEKIMSSYKSGSSLFHDLTVSEDNKLVFPNGYSDHVDKVLTNKVQKIAELADGMATPLQRAAITKSWIGCFVMIHKQFLPLILQRAFGKRVYDYDMEQYKNHVFGTVFEYVYQVALNNLFAGIGLGSVLGLAFGNGLFIAGGASTGAIINMIGRYRRSKSGQKAKSIQEINDEFFSNYSDRKSTMISNANRYNFREFMIKVASYHIIALLVSMLCAKADDDDDKLLDFLAYIARAFQWESYTEFRLDDMLNTTKSPSPATGSIDATQSAINTIVNTISPQGNFLDFLSSFDGYDDEEDDIIYTPGAYEGWHKLQRDIFKATPYHNFIEQIYDSDKKRRYFENQIMKQDD